MIRNPNDLARYDADERSNHWLVAICFVLLALSGLAFFHPAFWPLTQLFGGGTWTRILHPFIGVVMAVSFLRLYFRFRDLNRMTDIDREWLSRVREMVDGNDHNMPEQGKYNGGQKVMFWALAASVLLLAVSGVLMWRTFVTPPAELARFAAMVHAIAAAIAIGLILVHIYAAIWTRGTMRAMIYGTVTRAWAKQHHRAWYREVTGKQ